MLGSNFTWMASWMSLLHTFLFEVNIVNVYGSCLTLHTLFHNIQIERVLIFGRSFNVFEQWLILYEALYAAVFFLVTLLWRRESPLKPAPYRLHRLLILLTNWSYSRVRISSSLLLFVLNIEFGASGFVEPRTFRISTHTSILNAQLTTLSFACDMQKDLRVLFLLLLYILFILGRACCSTWTTIFDFFKQWDRVFNQWLGMFLLDLILFFNFLITRSFLSWFLLHKLFYLTELWSKTWFHIWFHLYLRDKFLQKNSLVNLGIVQYLGYNYIVNFVFTLFFFPQLWFYYRKWVLFWVNLELLKLILEDHILFRPLLACTLRWVVYNCK